MTGLGLALRDVARSLVTALRWSPSAAFSRGRMNPPRLPTPSRKPTETELPADLKIYLDRTIASAIHRDSGAAQRAEMEHDGMRQRALPRLRPSRRTLLVGLATTSGLTGLAPVHR